MPKFRIKNALFGYFWPRILEKLLSYLKLAPSNLSISKFQEKEKCLNAGPKMPDLGILGLELKIILSYLKSAPSNLSNCKISRIKQKYLNLGPNMPYLDIFGLEL